MTIANNLNNIKWIFNKSKFSGTLDEFKTAMKSAIDNISNTDLTDAILSKHLQNVTPVNRTPQLLKTTLKNKIDNNLLIKLVE